MFPRVARWYDDRPVAGGGPAPKVIVLTTFDLDEYVYAAIRAGASGFLLKDARPEELLGAVRAVVRGDAVVAPSATRRLLDQLAGALPAGGGRRDDQRLAQLTPREREVLHGGAGSRAIRWTTWRIRGWTRRR